MFDYTGWKRDAEIIADVLKGAKSFDKEYRIPRAEFTLRQEKVIAALDKAGLDLGFVYSDEHYNGDVPYLAGNTNISIEPVAGVIGKNGFFLLAGLEGGYCAEQLAPRSGCSVRKVEMLKLADEDYPVEAVRIEDVLEEACGKKPVNIGLLTPSEVVPLSFFKFFRNYFGGEEYIVNAQELYYKIKYIKSDNEMRMVEEASKIADVMMEGMLSVLRPGMLETQVAQWGYCIALELGAEEQGFDVIVGANESNRTLIGKALNKRINEGDYVMLGVAPKRDGLTACERHSVICVSDASKITDDQKFWFEFVEGAYKTGLAQYIRVSENNLPAKLQEQALVDYFAYHSEDISKRLGKSIDMTRQKPYTGTHNGGYTECQEFYGAITLNSNEPLGEQIVTMLDVAVRGYGNHWNDIVIPGMDYVLVEKTLGKYGKKVKVLNDLPINVQHFVGKNF